MVFRRTAVVGNFKMNIEEQIAQLNFQDHDQVISFYESNRIYFDNYQRLENTEKISEFINIKLHYADSLTDKHYLDKLLPVLDEVSELLQKLPKEHWNYEQSKRHMRFLKGMALGRQKKFKESYSIFKQLIKEEPDHFYYKVWYDHSRLGTYNWLFNGIAIVGGVLIFGDIIFSFSGYLPFDIGMVGVVIVVLAYLTQKGLNEYFKRKKLHHNK
ncbi:MAG: hypothetical protein ACOC2E_01695 [Bacteroidota bacterium]